MISKQEVMALSAELQLQAHVVEKDYALGWFLAGIAAHPVIGPRWVFKGGTCLKKCYFETYRFSEDLDFTLQDAEHLDETFLAAVFDEIGEWVYDACGLQLPSDARKFEVFTNPRGTQSAQGRVGYRGPLGRAGDPPRIKLDLAADEVLVLTPVQRPVHHPYTDLPAEGIRVLSYSFEEVFAEKMRALAERQRPRDLYDVVHLYRRQDLQPDRAIVRSTLARKCEFKGIPVPTYAALSDRPERTAIEVEWEQMLAHQLPTCPPFAEFWRELPEVFEWLNETIAAPTFAAVPTAAFGREAMDVAWRVPPMVQAWGAEAGSLETIRFAAANRLCVQLDYTKANGEHIVPTIEPYAVRRTSAGDLLLFGVKVDTGESRSYRVDRIRSASVTRTAFSPRYAVELTASGPLAAPSVARQPATSFSPSRSPAARRPSGTRATMPSRGFGLTYTFACTVCDKTFKRDKYDAALNPHKTKQGWPCPGRIGFLKGTSA
ncbi:nucleotidyl transferase AbiEii/AbiGii toxin family protein [Methylibium petroleiphilum]|uniref:nucleotidyl transferase AbiEii/AbiGii toxin family protein n=1 Tax=Methylibium petroleiphilum TaxID=105560 RepID=UPI001AC0C23B|nr:nucleotidyl transferase AbiEii/AbiGii toxin family protein [Methylibium petroleiphilum]MBN9206907.1 nucleotidyl transferase AbiEii/AbiGii toxin family protein [Methylibium petroleiphilum]